DWHRSASDGDQHPARREQRALPGGSCDQLAEVERIIRIRPAGDHRGGPGHGHLGRHGHGGQRNGHQWNSDCRCRPTPRGVGQVSDFPSPR
ncbi:MAG: hypothetical protein ACK55I_07440, partial [bacterium]